MKFWRQVHNSYIWFWWCNKAYTDYIALLAHSQPLLSSILFFFNDWERQTAICSTHLDVSGVLEAWLSYVLLQMVLESLSGGSSRGMQLLMPSPKEQPSSITKFALFDLACSFGRGTHGEVKKEKGICLASQIDHKMFSHTLCFYCHKSSGNPYC